MEGWRMRRNRWLVAHGYVDEHGWSDYSAYTRSPHWRRFRSDYFAAHPAICSVCDARGVRLILHHLTYKRIGAERTSDVRPLCKRCHELIHDQMSTGKRLYYGALEELRRIFLEWGSTHLDKLYDDMVDRRVENQQRRRRGKGRSQRSGRMLIKNAANLSPEERSKYGF